MPMAGPSSPPSGRCRPPRGERARPRHPAPAAGLRPRGRRQFPRAAAARRQRPAAAVCRGRQPPQPDLPRQPRRSAAARACVHPAAAGQVLLAADGADLSTPELIRILARGQGRGARLFALPEAVFAVLRGLPALGPAVSRLTLSLQVDDGATRAAARLDAAGRRRGRR